MTVQVPFSKAFSFGRKATHDGIESLLGNCDKMTTTKKTAEETTKINFL